MDTITTQGVQKKFLQWLAGILFFFCLFWSATIYLYQKNRMQAVALRETEMVMATVNANRTYLQEVLRPRMYDLLGHDRFVLEAMSTSYVSRVIMENFKKEMPNIIYRRVAIKAMNPSFEANGMEREMIRYFEENPGSGSWQGLRMIDGEHYYMRFSPVQYKESCLHCHGRPEDAPQNIRDTYGQTNGFFRTAGHIDSLVGVGIRVEENLRRISMVALAAFCTIFISFFFLYAVICFSFNRLIVRNIRALLEIFQQNLSDQSSEHLYWQPGERDEIDELQTTAAMLARNLQENRLQLQDYAENLERKVEERTTALEQSREQLHRQMLSQGNELRTLNIIAELTTQSVDLLDILPKVLRQTLEVIPARGVGIYLFREERNGFFLQCRENAPELAEQLSCDMVFPQIPPDLANAMPPLSACEAGCDSLYSVWPGPSAGKLLNVPVCCRNRLLGVMTLSDYDCHEIDPKHRELLLSIGRHIGVTVESLQNMANLLRGKELLQSVFDAIADLVVLISPDGYLQMVNKAFQVDYHCSADRVIGRHTEELAKEYPVPFQLFSQISRIRLREPVSDCKRLDNGQSFETHFYPAVDDNGELKNIVCYAKEVTQQKQMEYRMQQNEKLVALGQLAAGVAHEINNPLGIILCHTDLLKEDLAQAPDTLKDLSLIEKHVRNCQRIVRDLLSFARNQQTTRTPGQLNSAVEQVVSMVASQLAKQHIVLELELDPAMPIFAMDIEKMKQVVMNLIINAAQAIGNTREDGRITVKSHYFSIANQAKLFVLDNGPGIAPEIKDKIFEPFFTTKGLKEGTGLGLSLSYGIVHDHGGEITIESAPGQETVFTVVLPLQDV